MRNTLKKVCMSIVFGGTSCITIKSRKSGVETSNTHQWMTAMDCLSSCNNRCLGSWTFMIGSNKLFGPSSLVQMCKQHVGINILARCFRIGSRSYKQSHVIAILRGKKKWEMTEFQKRSQSKAIVFRDNPSFPVFGLYPVTFSGWQIYVMLCWAIAWLLNQG